MDTESKYEGWQSFQTWLVWLMLSNDYELHNYWTDYAKKVKDNVAVASALKSFIEESLEAMQLFSAVVPKKSFVLLYKDLVNSSLEKVNWMEIAQELTAK